MSRPYVPIGLILVAVALVYARVTLAGFCGYDDFNEAFRAQFFDGRDPTRVFTALHLSLFMYRPVTSALQLETWNLFHHSPIAFRVRNLAMHLVAVAFVYAIANLLSKSRAVAAGAALLFGFNPEANQAIVTAIWTNTTAYALQLGAFYCFLDAVARHDARRPWRALLVTSLGLMLVSLFTYEPTIVFFGLVALYLIVCRFREPALSRAFWIVLGVGTFADLAIFAVLRHAVHAESAPLLPIPEIAKNGLLYLGDLVLPIDRVLGHDLLGVPLPYYKASLHLSSLIPTFVAAAVLVGAIALIVVRPGSTIGTARDVRTLLFLAVSIPTTIVPIVAYREHISEFNLYVPAALWATIVAIVLSHLARTPRAYAAAIAIALLPALGGVFVRNDRVMSCASIATRILDALPTSAWRQGDWKIRLATAPGETLLPNFALYNDDGLDTLQIPGTPVYGAQEAAELLSGNERVRVAVVPPGDLARGCARVHTCFYVWPDGRVKETSSR